MKFYLNFQGGPAYDETNPALYIKCNYCGEDVGYLIIKKGGSDAQIDLLRMVNDYKTYGVCIPCSKNHLNITKDPEADKRLAFIESQRIISDGDR